MQIEELIRQMGGVQSVARELGVSPDQAQSGAAALLPAILGGFKKQAQSQPAGLDGLLNTVSGLGGGSLMDEVLAPRPTDLNHGNEVLGQIFGSKDTSRAVAANAAERTGLDPALLKKMLPLLAMMAAGYMARQQGGAAPARGGGGLGGLLGGLLRGADRGGQGGGGLGSLLEMGSKGNPLDEILGKLNQTRR
jgi:hypothetical protein